MTTKIIEEWSEYCENMGSAVTNIRNTIISKNTDTTISCDFANCLISLNITISSLEDFRDSFNGKNFKIYSVFNLDQRFDANVKSDRKASLLVLEKGIWLNKYRNIRETNTFSEHNYSIVSIKDEDLVYFGNVVFDAFNYDKANFQQSIELYRNGFKSSKVHYYGLKLDEEIVSCALLHNNTTMDIAGLELVSTRPKYQHRGFSKILISNVLNKNFAGNTKLIWLFAIRDSIAERFYSMLGFKKIANIFIQNVNES